MSSCLPFGLAPCSCPVGEFDVGSQPKNLVGIHGDTKKKEKRKKR